MNTGLTKATEAAKAIGAKLAVPNFGDNRPNGMTDFNDLHQLKGLDAVLDCIVNAQECITEQQSTTGNISTSPKAEKRAKSTNTNQNNVPNDWPPIVLPGNIKTPDIPANTLPTWAGEMCKAVALETQTPPAASVMLALSAIATCVQRRFEVAPYGDNSYTEPLCIWTLSGLPSGSRKTPVLNALSKPLKRWEKLLADRMRPKVAANQAAIRVAKKRIEKLSTLR